MKHWRGSLELLLIHLKLLVVLAPLLLVHLAIHIRIALSFVTKEGEGQAGSREGVRTRRGGREEGLQCERRGVKTTGLLSVQCATASAISHSALRCVLSLVLTVGRRGSMVCLEKMEGGLKLLR